MKRIPVITIFDVGKTNKKLLLFNEQYKLVHSETRQLEETIDEDGFGCEDVHALTRWVRDSFDRLIVEKKFEIKAVNFSGYGASFVYLDEENKVFLPLYNYLKPFDPQLQKQFYDRYGGEDLVSRETASPVLGNLNSGLQMYRLKYEKPAAFARIKYALHLPQYLSFVLSSKLSSDLTSLGCHTSLWNFHNNKYHSWVKLENIQSKLAPILNCESLAGHLLGDIPVGIGLHDSSAALIPFLTAFKEPFLLLSTGTWCISLNPFNHSPLTDYELHQDCLCYLSYKGKPVKASRLFSGYEHEQQVKKMAAHFNKATDYFEGISYNSAYVEKVQTRMNPGSPGSKSLIAGESGFDSKDLNSYKSYEEAYHKFIYDVVLQQAWSSRLVLEEPTIKRIFVDGGFSKNSVYMHLLAAAFPGIEVCGASFAQASGLGAAMAIHPHWNKNLLPAEIIELKLYSGKDTLV